MRISVLKYFIPLLALAIIPTACSTKSPYWDSQEYRYHIPDENITIDLPKKISWDIAATTDLPDNILFCAANQDMRICTFLIKEFLAPAKNIWDCTEEEIANITGRITMQYTTEHDVKYGDVKTEKHLYNSSLKSIKFNTEICIDEAKITYTGYIFTDNNNLFCLFVIEPNDLSPENHRIALETLERIQFGS